MSSTSISVWTAITGRCASTWSRRQRRRRKVAEAPKKSLRGLAAAAGSFTVFAIAIIVLAAKGVVTMQMGLLMLVALVGLYFGFGVLIVVWRFVGRLE